MQARTYDLRTIALAAIFGALISVSACLAQGYTDPNAPAVDPPGRVARIAVMQGEVSLEPAGANSFSQAELNYPLTIGDRVYADLQALTELQVGGLTVRMSNGADLSLTNLTDAVAQFGLAQGSIRVVSRETPAPDGSSGVVEIDTPNGTVWVQAAGDIRIDTYPQNNSTVVTVTSGQVEIVGTNLDQTLGPNEAVQLSGVNPVSTQFVGQAAPDALDQFDQNRESQYQNTIAQESQYVSPDMIGGDDLAAYGSWTPDPSYGAVWYPRGVAVDWVPYHNGRWCYIRPWGWTWVESEPWGFAPFHYGRWSNFNGRWGWVPGPPPAVYGRPVRPIYSPALVAFVGGSGFGVTAWFPLGPGEAFVPWYATSAAYANRVNVTNIYSRNPAQVRAALSNRTTNLYGGGSVYSNRSMGMTALNQNDFAAGRHVERSQQIRMDGNLRQQLSQAPVAVRPAATPTATGVAQAPARAVPPVQARPQWTARPAGANGGGVGSINRGNPATGGNQPRTYTPAPNPTQPRNSTPPAAPENRPNTPPVNVPQPRPYAPPAAPAPTTPRVETPQPEASPRQPAPDYRQREPQPQQQPEQQRQQQSQQQQRPSQAQPQQLEQQQIQQQERQQQIQQQQREQQQREQQPVPRQQPIPQQAAPPPQPVAPRGQPAPTRPAPAPAKPAEPKKDPPK